MEANAEADRQEEPELSVSKRKRLSCTLKGIKSQRLKRVFNIKVSICSDCWGPMKIIASIDDPIVIGKILSHLEATNRAPLSAKSAAGARAPPLGVC